jgi:glutaredoxin-like protein NrdH
MSEKLMLYALSTCIHCRNTKQFLDEYNIDYDYVFVDKLKGEEREKVINEVKQYNPAVSFPTLVFGKEVIVGFKKDRIKEVLGL